MRNQPKQDARADDLTRAKQYQGVDPSGYQKAPQATEGSEVNGQWREPTPGNHGEAGGRWHDHEAPYEGGRAVEADDEAKRDDRGEPHAEGQPEGGFVERARGIWPGGPGGAHGYGNGGREGHAPEAAKAGGGIGDAKPEKARADGKKRSGTSGETSTPDDEATGHASAVGTSPSGKRPSGKGERGD